MFLNTNNVFHSSDIQIMLEELLKLRYTELAKEDGQKNQSSTYTDFLRIS